MEEEAEDLSQAIVLHEDKQYYPSALQVYGEEVCYIIYMVHVCYRILKALIISDE